MTEQTTIALIGLGGYGEQYLSHILKGGLEPDARLVAGIDVVPERSAFAPDLAAAGIPIYPDLETFYRKAGADLVIVAAPIHLHVPLSIAALSHGSNVLCEKPLCALEEEGERLIAAEKTSGKIVAIGYQWSFSDAVEELKKDIQSGLFGKAQEMKTLVLWPRNRSYFTRNSWAGRVRTDTGDWVLDSPINNAAAHFLHNMLFLFGKEPHTAAQPTEIQAELFRANPIENYDTAAVRMRTEPGTVLRMYVSHTIREVSGPRFSARFTDATLDFGSDHKIIARFADGREKEYGNPDKEPFSKLRRTIEAIRGGRTVPCGPTTALAHTRCVNRIQGIPVIDFPKERIRIDRIGEDSLFWVDGLAEEYERRYRSDEF
ncbi:MAG: Gfo/Idh/MocA family oxidoreductase [Treponemataceae bacterium]